MNFMQSLARNIRALTMEDPAQPLQPYSVLMDMLGMTITDSGMLVNEKTAMRQPTVHACVRVKSQGLASLPLMVFKRTKRGKEQAPSNRLWPMLHDMPNPQMTSMAWREGAEAQRQLWGNTFTEIQRDRANRPIAFWPLPSERTRAERRDNKIIYVTEATNTGEPRYIAPEDMLHVPALAFDGLTGISPVQIGKQTIGRALAMERFGAQYFGNGSRPSGVFTYKGGSLGEEEKNVLKKELKSATSGANALNSLLLEGDMEWKPMTIPNSEAQFVEAMKEIVADIARLFGVPLHLVQDLNRATNNNIEQQALEFLIYGLRPDAIKWEQELNKKLFQNTEYFTEHSMEGLLRGDFKTRMEGYAKLWQVGGISSDMMAQLEGWNPLPEGQGGDLRFVPINFQPLEAVQRGLDAAKENGQGNGDEGDTGDVGTPTDPTEVGGGGGEDTGDVGVPSDVGSEARRLILSSIQYVVRDAVSRTISRDKRDEKTVARIWKPVLQHAAQMTAMCWPGARPMLPALELCGERWADALWQRTEGWNQADLARIAGSEALLIREIMINQINGATQ